MSKNISVKINNGNETIETVKLNAASKKVIIKAQPNVNYELVDEATQYAPEMIDTKRVGNDLHIAFEGTDINKESDLVLEGYYEHDNTELLLGMAEDGQYYAYVPQSGMESDAVTLLADQVFAPQALGGNSVAAPFWAFNPNWLWVAAGVAAVGGIIAAASGSSGSGSSNKATDKPSDNTDKNNNSSNNDNTAKDTTAPAKPSIVTKHDGSVEITPPADADTKSVEVSYTDEAGTPKTATLTKGEDGTWTSNNPDVAVDPATGKATIPADKVQDGSPVKAKATDTAGNTGEEDTANAGNNPDTTAPAQPTVTAKDNGSVEVTPPADADTKSVDVSYTDEAGTPKTATLTKGTDGTWTSDNPDVAVDPITGKSTIPADKVQDGSPVKAKATDTAGNPSEEGTVNAGNNPATPDTTAPATPTVEAKDNGSVEITPPADADTKSVEVSYTDEAGTPKTATITKGEDGTWTSNNPDVALDPATGKATIPADKVQDGSPVKAKATDTAGNPSEEGTANAGNNPDTTAPNAPEVTSSTTDGSVTVQVPSNAKTGDMVEVTITPDTVSGNATPITVTLTKQADGSWTSDNESAVPNVKAGENSSIIPEDKVEDLSKVTVVTKDAMGNVSNKVETIAPLDPAKLSVNEEGKVVVTLPKQVNEGDLIYLNTIGGDLSHYNGAIGIEFHKTATGWDIASESRKEERDITKVDEYTYILNNLKPTSRVTAQHIEKDAVENFPNNAESSALDNETSSFFYTTSDRTKGSVVFSLIVPADNVPPGKPTISSNADGSVNITPPTDKDVKTIEVNYIDENGNPQNAVLTNVVRHGDYHYGRWTSNNPDVKVGKYGEATISADKVKDGSEVKAKATDESGNTGDDSIYETGVQYGSNTLDMGSGNDIVRISNDTNPKASIDGGDGFDTFEFVNRDNKAITTTISMISNFEKINIKGTLNNSVTISASDVEKNHCAKATVDASGKSHNNVLIVDGDAGDKVTLSGISKAASSQVTYEGNTYNVYNTGSNELWVDSDITVA